MPRQTPGNADMPAEIPFTLRSQAAAKTGVFRQLAAAGETDSFCGASSIRNLDSLAAMRQA